MRRRPVVAPTRKKMTARNERPRKTTRKKRRQRKRKVALRRTMRVRM